MVDTPEGQSFGYGGNDLIDRIENGDVDFINGRDAMAISERMRERGVKTAELDTDRRNCAKGPEGKDCRLTLTYTIQQLERENKEDADLYVLTVQNSLGN